MTTLASVKPPLAPSRRRAGRTVRPARSTQLDLLTFNIGAAGTERAQAILGWLRSRADQVIVLTETSGGPGTQLLAAGLAADGYSVCHTEQPGERGVLIASRVPIGRDLSDHLAVSLPCRARAVVLDTQPHKLLLAGVYIPSRDRSPDKVARKQAFIASLLNALGGLPPAQRARLVLAGDYNAVARGHQPPLPGFFAWEYGLHEELLRIGLRPAHQLCPGSGQPHSWIGRTGLGYLYDYIHLGRGLQTGLQRCRYLHAPREQRLSDHAAVAVRLGLS